MIYHFRHMYTLDLIKFTGFRRSLGHNRMELVVSGRYKSKICTLIHQVLLICCTIRGLLKLHLFTANALNVFRVTLVFQGLLDQILQVNFISE